MATKKETLELKQLELENALKEQELRKAKLEEADVAASLEMTRAMAEDAQIDLKDRKKAKVIGEARKANREIYLTGEVDDRIAAYFRGDFKSWEFEDQVEDNPPKPVTILINSPGGVVIPGLDMFDLIMEYRNKGWTINTKITGMAMSMAGVIAQAGEERLMTPRSTFMLHEVHAGTYGKTSEMKDQLKVIEDLQKHCASLLAERSHLSYEEVNTLWGRKDVFLTADETLEKGFVDRLVS